MTNREAVITLEKMKSGIKRGMKEKPAWYGGASEEERARYDAWSEERCAAIDIAVAVLMSEDKLIGLSKKAKDISSAIEGIMGGEVE